jgi:hypothetical protein
MTCEHVLGLIDAGPFAGYSREHLEAAWAHARACASCGAAREASLRVASALSAMPRVEAPPHLAANILARIERVETAVPVTQRSTAGWRTWAAAAGAVAASWGLVLSLPPHPTALTLLSPRAGGLMEGLAGRPPVALEAAVVLVAGLLLFIAGLFTPARRDH